MKYLAQIFLVKIAFFYVQAVACLCCYFHKLYFFKFVEYYEKKKNLSHSGKCRFLRRIKTINDDHISSESSSEITKTYAPLSIQLYVI